MAGRGEVLKRKAGWMVGEAAGAAHHGCYYQVLEQSQEVWVHQVVRHRGLDRSRLVAHRSPVGR